MKVRIGYGLGLEGLGAVVGAGTAAAFGAMVDSLEKHGFDSLWLSERISGPGPDPVVGLSVAAGRTNLTIASVSLLQYASNSAFNCSLRSIGVPGSMIS